ncbi:MAG: acetylxylan esterase [Candidatus Hydrogenedens sp.]|nr:acetylxylan esterase [Candidatus Hydrogenedens sp.]
MSLSLVLVCASLSQIFTALSPDDGLHLLEAWEQASSVELSQVGNYQLWLAADQRIGGSITLDGQEYSVPRAGRDAKKEEAFWHDAGKISLKNTVVQVDWNEGIFALLLSRIPDFSPVRTFSDTRVLPMNQGSTDRRLTEERHTDTVFIMPSFDSVSAWEDAAEEIRMRLRLGSGLFPIPEKTEMKARIFDEFEGDGFTVSKVHFEPLPGFLATGNLYRPPGEGPFPAVVSPHGHWTKGRLENTELGSVPGRCITLARMGILTFSYDMIGYVDSKQLPHRWGNDQEKLWGVHPFAMQLWTGLRAVDLMESLPDVDPQRIACTGASGGGTQTFTLTALEPRICLSAPVNMISSTMQGGCLCENAPLLRLTNSNMEIGALAAPRPLLLISTTGDWTRETPRVEYPAIKSIYALYDAQERVANVHLDFPHNYNLQSREAMYRFFGEHLLGGDWLDYEEPPFEIPDEAWLRVFPGEDPPEGYLSGDALRAHLVELAKERRKKHLAGALEDPAASADGYHSAFSALFTARQPGRNELAPTRIAMEERDSYVLERWLIGRVEEGDRIPALLYRSRESSPQDSVILVHGRGKAALADLREGGPGPLIRRFLAEGKMVLSMDAFLLGEYQGPEKAVKRVEKGKFSDPFLPTTTACRVQDILTAASFLRSRFDTTDSLDLVGLEAGGLWSLFAAAVDRDIQKVFVDLYQQDISDDSFWEEKFFVPGIRSLGDVPAACIAGGPERFQFFNGTLSEELTTLGLTLLPEAPFEEAR